MSTLRSTKGRSIMFKMNGRCVHGGAGWALAGWAELIGFVGLSGLSGATRVNQGQTGSVRCAPTGAGCYLAGQMPLRLRPHRVAAPFAAGWEGRREGRKELAASGHAHTTDPRIGSGDCLAWAPEM